jgi:hypothetical protein
MPEEYPYFRSQLLQDFIRSEAQLAMWMNAQGWPSVEEIQAKNKAYMAKAEAQAKASITERSKSMKEIMARLELGCCDAAEQREAVKELKRLQGERARYIEATRDVGHSWNDDAREYEAKIKELQDRNDELEALFALQRTRVQEAEALYVAAHPRADCPHGYKPDLGKLVAWLLEERQQLQRRLVAATTTIRTLEKKAAAETA